MSEVILAKMEAIERNQQHIIKQLQGNEPVFLDVHKAGEMYGLTGQTFRLTIKKGILEGFKFGKKVYVKKEQVIEKIRAGKIETTYARA